MLHKLFFKLHIDKRFCFGSIAFRIKKSQLRSEDVKPSNTEQRSMSSETSVTNFVMIFPFNPVLGGDLPHGLKGFLRFKCNTLLRCNSFACANASYLQVENT